MDKRNRLVSGHTIAVINLFLLGCAVSDRQGALAQEAAPDASGQCYRSVPLDRPVARDRSEMCEELLQRLNETCDSGPMVCGLVFPTDDEAFSLPEWTEVDLNENLELVENMIRGQALRVEQFNPGGTDRVWNDLSEQIVDRAHESTRLEESEIDIFNRGVRESVYRLTLNTCEAAKERVFKLDPINMLERHAQVITNPEWRERAARGGQAFPGAAVADWFPADFYYFDGRTYEFRWSPEPWVREVSYRESTTFDEPLVGMRAVCNFEYLDNTN